MSTKTLKVGILDSVAIKLALVSLGTIEQTCSFSFKELDRWYKNNEHIFIKYKNTIESYCNSNISITYSSNTEPFFQAFLNKNKLIAEIIASRFPEFYAVIKKELECYKTMPDQNISEANLHINIFQQSASYVLAKRPDLQSIVQEVKNMISQMQSWIEYRRDEHNAKMASVNYYRNVQHYSSELDSFLSENFCISDLDNWLTANSSFIAATNCLIAFTDKYKIDNQNVIFTSAQKARAFLDILSETREILSIGYKEYKRQREEMVRLIQPVEGRFLDEQQLNCIFCDRNNQLILAGAGSGKTTTIIGKVKYLLKTKKCTPDQILLLSFTNKSASEMKDRIKTETGYDMDVMTFHKLGLNIISGVEGKKPSIYSKPIQEFTRSDIKAHLNDPSYRKAMIIYCFFSPNKYKTEFDFETKNEYDEYIDTNPPMTFKKETVKSYCEMEIANYLYSNNIRYSYERPYEHDTSDTEYAGYHPDFYLDDYGIYIEFYAVDKQGNVPKHFQGKHGANGKSEYIQGITWKRSIHNQYGTKLIELYYSDKQNNRLTEKLHDALVSYNIPIVPMSDEELWNTITAENKNIISAVCDIIGTVITLSKANGYDINALRNIASTSKTVLLELVDPILSDYVNMLSSTDQIDFNDMIYNASKYIRSGRVSHDYKYVIVDEYQDISKARYTLLHELRNAADFKLFCVGDDWQSIYRFAGSDIGYIINFPEYWGLTKISKIETTYRFSQKLITVSSKFIMKNPAQTEKILRSHFDIKGFPLGFIKAYNDKYLIKFMSEKICELERNATVFLIGRYTFDKDMLNGSNFKVRYDTAGETYTVNFYQRPDLKIEFITAHKSKGLQADYVFILNNKNKSMGFPSKIQDDPLIDMLLEGCDNYSYAEERRLFYVAMTRAKKKVRLLVQQDSPSCFASELMNEYGKEAKSADWICPLCGGRLLKKSGKNGDFIGCSNYSKTGCKYTRNIK